METDKAAVQSARINLNFTHIVSPIDGKTGPILIQPGNVIPAASATAQPLVSITQVQPIKVSFMLPQNGLAQIQNQFNQHRLMAVVPIAGAAGGAEKAPVDFVSNAVSAATGTIELRADFPNSDMRLVPGQTVTVAATINQIPGATVVPRDAVNLGPENSFVLVVGKDGKAYSRTVKVLNDDGVNDAIQGEVKPGDKVVTDGQLRVTPGQPVRVIEGPGRPEDRRPAMNISAPFIQRPVMTVLLMVALVAFGLFGYSALPVSELPAVDFPTITRFGQPAGRRSPDHGQRRGDAAGIAILHHRRRLLHDVAKLVGHDLGHHPVRPGPRDRRRGGRRAGRHPGGVAAVAGQHAVAAHLAQSQSGGLAHPVPGDAVRFHAAL